MCCRRCLLPEVYPYPIPYPESALNVCCTSLWLRPQNLEPPTFYLLLVSMTLHRTVPQAENWGINEGWINPDPVDK